MRRARGEGADPGGRRGGPGARGGAGRTGGRAGSLVERAEQEEVRRLRGVMVRDVVVLPVAAPLAVEHRGVVEDVSARAVVEGRALRPARGSGRWAGARARARAPTRRGGGGADPSARPARGPAPAPAPDAPVSCRVASDPHLGPERCGSQGRQRPHPNSRTEDASTEAATGTEGAHEGRWTCRSRTTTPHLPDAVLERTDHSPQHPLKSGCAHSRARAPGSLAVPRVSAAEPSPAHSRCPQTNFWTSGVDAPFQIGELTVVSRKCLGGKARRE